MICFLECIVQGKPQYEVWKLVVELLPWEWEWEEWKCRADIVNILSLKQHIIKTAF